MKKKTAVSGAVIATAAMMLMGTFAWESISQKALNEKQEEMNPGARLHDDFNGSNKDVYVENFTDPDDVGMPIYARIRFFEYLEIGTGAGKSTDDVPDKKAVSVIDGAKLDDTSTWTLHNPYGTEDVFHDYFEWEQGGQTSYLPTFNKDKDDKTADINGTLEGTTPGDDVHYDDYVDYTDPANGSVTEKEIYDHNPLEESEEVQHDVKQTEDATVLTMSEWKAQGCPQGEFWVYDTDGWAYWATAIEPGTASGCLLNGIKETSALYDDYYYGIDVEAQFVTAGEWGYDDDGNRFFGTGGEVTNDAMHLLAVASGEKYKIEITNRNNIKYLDPGDTATFKGKILFGTSVVMDDTLVWSVVDAKSDDTQINQNGILTVGADETSNCIIVKATSTNDQELSAMYVVYVNVPDSYTVEIYTEDTIPARSLIAVAGREKQFFAEVTKNGAIDKNSNVIWELSGQEKTETTLINGLLQVDAGESSGTVLTLKAICDRDASVVATYEVKVITEVEYISYIQIGTTETVKIDDIEWYVLAKKGDQYLLWMKSYEEGAAKAPEAIGTHHDAGRVGGAWSVSNFRKYLDKLYTDRKLPTLNSIVQETMNITWENFDNGVGKWVNTSDRYFLLTEADIFGTTAGETAGMLDYTYGSKPFVNMECVLYTQTQVLRNSGNEGYYAFIYDMNIGGGKANTLGYGQPYSYVRPACWVKLPE